MKWSLLPVTAGLLALTFSCKTTDKGAESQTASSGKKVKWQNHAWSNTGAHRSYPLSNRGHKSPDYILIDISPPTSLKDSLTNFKDAKKNNTKAICYMSAGTYEVERKLSDKALKGYYNSNSKQLNEMFGDQEKSMQQLTSFRNAIKALNKKTSRSDKKKKCTKDYKGTNSSKERSCGVLPGSNGKKLYTADVIAQMKKIADYLAAAKLNGKRLCWGIELDNIELMSNKFKKQLANHIGGKGIKVGLKNDYTSVNLPKGKKAANKNMDWWSDYTHKDFFDNFKSGKDFASHFDFWIMEECKDYSVDDTQTQCALAKKFKGPVLAVEFTWEKYVRDLKETVYACDSEKYGTSVLFEKSKQYNICED